MRYILFGIYFVLVLMCFIEKNDDGTVKITLDIEEAKETINKKLGRDTVATFTKKQQNVVVKDVATETPLIPKSKYGDFINHVCDPSELVAITYHVIDKPLIVLRIFKNEKEEFEYSYGLSDGMSTNTHDGFIFHSNNKYNIGDELYITD